MDPARFQHCAPGPPCAQPDSPGPGPGAGPGPSGGALSRWQQSRSHGRAGAARSQRRAPPERGTGKLQGLGFILYRRKCRGRLGGLAWFQINNE